MSDEGRTAQHDVRRASLRDREVRLTQAIHESRDIATKLLDKGRAKEAEAQRAQTAELRQKLDQLQAEIHGLRNTA
jgi:hypothetical protein